MSRDSAIRQRERSDWLERAEAAAPVLADCADESARLRTLAPQAVQTLRDHGIFAMAGIPELGGHDVHPATQVEVLETLAAADLSGGWIAMIQTHIGAIAGARLPDGPALDALFGDGYPSVAGTANPEGQARADTDGQFRQFRLSGRWSFASGIRHCDWVMAGAIRTDLDRPAPISFALSTQDVEIEDSWHVIGLQGTGSCHYRIDDADGLAVDPAFQIGARPDGSAWRGGRWHSAPTWAFVGPGHCGIALGAARRALQIAAESAERQRFGQARAVADRAAFQRDYGQAAARYAAARAYALAVFDDAVDLCDAGQPVTPAGEAAIRAAGVYVTDAALEIVRFTHRHGGGAAGFQGHPLEQLLRDISMAAQHIYCADTAYERHGAFLLNRRADGVL